MLFSTFPSTVLAAAAVASPLALPLAIPALDAVPVPLTDAQLEKRGLPFIRGIRVESRGPCDLGNAPIDVYTGSSSPNTKVSRTGQNSLQYCASGNTNLGFGGAILYVQVDRTDSVLNAAATARCWRQGGPNYSYQDMALGAGGDYRYCTTDKDPQYVNQMVDVMTQIAMWRTSNAFGSPPSGWSGITQDINQGRRGDYNVTDMAGQGSEVQVGP